MDVLGVIIFTLPKINLAIIAAYRKHHIITGMIHLSLNQKLYRKRWMYDVYDKTGEKVDSL